jgi:hypothetical protein
MRVSRGTWLGMAVFGVAAWSCGGSTVLSAGVDGSIDGSSGAGDDGSGGGGSGSGGSSSSGVGGSSSGAQDGASVLCGSAVCQSPDRCCDHCTGRCVNALSKVYCPDDGNPTHPCFDASDSSTSDALVVTSDDGGIFVCGTSASCDGRSQVCEHVTGGPPPGVDLYECIPIPATCYSDVSCACVVMALKGRGAGACSSVGSDLTVQISAP